ncbi:hypothetical protein AnigIFM62618_002652 [Aspergillus niger]|nr:hypothetical protein AnigIFM62618_002652 [Aspergillus niger]
MTAIMKYFRRSQASDSGEEIYGTVNTDGDANWGNISITDVHDKNGNAVEIKGTDYLGVAFLSPAKLSDDIRVSTDPWCAFSFEKSSHPSGDDLEVHVKFTFQPSSSDRSDGFRVVDFHFSMAGDPTDEHYENSVRLWKNYLPDVSGTVPIACDPRPDGITADSQALFFENDDGVFMKDVPFGVTTEVDLNRGTYEITASELFTDDETIVAIAKVQPAQVEVEEGKTAPTINVTYAVQHYSSTDVVIDNISGLEGEEVHVTFSNAENPLYDFWSLVPGTTKPRRVLPPTGDATISVDPIIVNNIQYDFTRKEIDLSRNTPISFTADDVKQHEIQVPGAVKLPIKLKKQDSITAGALTVHLMEKTSRFIYTNRVDMQDEAPQFPVLVGPGDYEVQVHRFIADGVLYKVTSDPTLTVSEDGNTVLDLSIDVAVNLNVPGFPNFLSFGGCTRDLSRPSTFDESDDDLTNFVQAGASSIFKYAGLRGNGDPDDDITKEEECTPKVIEFARDIEKAIGTDHTVLPVLISYTCNFSGGEDVLLCTTKHKHSLGNLIQALQLLMDFEEAPRPLRAAWIFNPDFIGECQKRGYTADSEVRFLDSLKEALKFRNEEHMIDFIPEDIDNTIRGYVRALHWLVRTMTKDPQTGKPAVSLGWQVNLWAGEKISALWIYKDENVAPEEAKKTADYLDAIGVWPKTVPEKADDELPPVDFLAVDRWERDDLTSASYPVHFCFAPREWSRYLDFCEALSMELHAPVMPWQISAARTPIVEDDVKEDFPTAQHWGTGGSYFLGDPSVGSGYRNIHKSILALKLDALFYNAKSVEELFQRSQPFDLTVPGYHDLPLRGMFSVLLGGGDTTGIVNSLPAGSGERQAAWVREKLAEYSKNPIYFQTD